MMAAWMRIALANFLVSPSIDQNLVAMQKCAQKAADGGADLVLFPEAAPTGLNITDDPTHDLPLGAAIPGPVFDRLSDIARANRILLAAGLLEYSVGDLYDSAVILGRSGELLCRYRRIQPQWHGPDADPRVYRQGDCPGICTTPFGRLAILVCGDLFDDGICDQLARQRPDLLLFPFSRNFGDGSHDQQRWDREELPRYIERTRRLGCPSVWVNEFADYCTTEWPPFGGAWIIAANGTVIASAPLGRACLLMADLDLTTRRRRR